MRTPRDGSILVMALVAVAATTMLAVGLSAWLRPHIAFSTRNAALREDTLKCHACIGEFAEKLLCADTNGYDQLGETWHAAYASESLPGAAISAEFEMPGQGRGEAPGVCDEESRLPLNLDSAEPLEELLFVVTGLEREICRRIAGEIHDLRPIVRREQIKLAPLVTPEVYAALAPHVTAAPVESVNINTAGEPVLKALFGFAKKYDSTATLTLAAKILAFREGGGSFTSTSPAGIAEELGGLTQAEMLLVSACRQGICTESRYFSGVSTYGSARVYFTYDRREKRLARVVACGK